MTISRPHVRAPTSGRRVSVGVSPDLSRPRGWLAQLNRSAVRNAWIYRYDRSHGTSRRDHRARSPRTAARGTHARLRAPQAPQPDARVGAGALLRVAVSDPEEDAPLLAHRGDVVHEDPGCSGVQAAAHHL